MTLTAERRYILFVQGIFFCHSFWDFQASTPYQKQVPDSDSTLHQFCVMVASCPSLRCSFRKKHLSHAEKQSVWSRSCGLQDLLQYSDCALSCAMRLLQINEHLSRLSFQQQWVGSGSASLSAACSQNVTHCRKEICSTCLFKTSIPAVPFWNCNHPLPTRSRFLRATVRSTSSALWLHHAHPFVAAIEKNLVMQRSRRSGHGVVVSKICYVQYSDCVQDLDYRILIVLSVVTCDCCKPMSNCRD